MPFLHTISKKNYWNCNYTQYRPSGSEALIKFVTVDDGQPWGGEEGGPRPGALCISSAFIYSEMEKHNNKSSVHSQLP